MKSQAFLIRVLICFLISLVPASELEDRIYSGRMALRGQWTKNLKVLIIDIDPADMTSAENLRLVEAKLAAQEPAAMLFASADNPKSLKLDADGVIRRALLLPKGGPSLVYRALLKLGHFDKLSRRPHEAHFINYIGGSGSMPRCHIAQVPSLSPGSPCADLRGKILLINDDPDGMAVLKTPLGEMSRAEILANDIFTVVDHHPISAASFAEVALIIIAMIFLAGFYIIYYPVLISAIAVTGTGIFVVLVVFQVIFELLGFYIPSVNLSLALLLTYLVFTGYRLAFQENLQWRSLKQAQYLRELDQLKTNFLSLVSHDLKTPIAKIQAVVERLRRELQMPPEQRSDWRELLESIENSNKELRDYITSILNLSRIESQKVILKKRSNDVNRIIEQALKRLRPLAQQKNITIEEHLEPLFSIECDEDLMRQVVTNLIDNAIKYSPVNSNVIVRSQEEAGCVRVEVEDFGPGIPKDQLPLMFRKFSRFLRPIKEQVKGTGLGLYLSKYFIELHGGSIQLRSIEGKGTTFSFTLPLRQMEAEAVPQPAP